MQSLETPPETSIFGYFTAAVGIIFEYFYTMGAENMRFLPGPPSTRPILGGEVGALLYGENNVNSPISVILTWKVARKSPPP